MQIYMNQNSMYGIHKQDYNFFPKTYILPIDTMMLRRDWDESAHKKWILKPVSLYLQ